MVWMSCPLASIARIGFFWIRVGHFLFPPRVTINSESMKQMEAITIFMSRYLVRCNIPPKVAYLLY